MAQTIPVLALLAALGSGLLGGFFFAFSNVVMPALRRVSPPAGIAAMQAVNVVVLNPVFFLAFFGTPLVGLGLGLHGLLNHGQGGSILLPAAGLSVVAGMFGVTVAFNVPMNGTLAPMDPSAPASAAYWRHYLARWTMWNHVRTVACVVACILYLLAFRALP